MPDLVRHDIGFELMRVQFGGEPKNFKPMPTLGAGAYEIRVRDESGVYRAIYVAKFEKMDIEIAKARYRMIGGKS